MEQLLGGDELLPPKQKLSRKQRMQARKAARARDRAAGSDDEDAQLQAGSAFQVRWCMNTPQG